MPVPFDVQLSSDETKVTIRESLDINGAPALADEIDKVVATRPLSEAPALTLAHSKVFMPMNKRVIGFTMDPFGIHRFDNVDVTE